MLQGFIRQNGGMGTAYANLRAGCTISICDGIRLICLGSGGGKKHPVRTGICLCRVVQVCIGKLSVLRQHCSNCKQTETGTGPKSPAGLIFPCGTVLLLQYIGVGWNKQLKFQGITPLMDFHGHTVYTAFDCVCKKQFARFACTQCTDMTDAVFYAILPHPYLPAFFV